MTRIAAGTAPPNRPAIDETPARLGGTSVEAGTAGGASAPRSGGVQADSGPDRPPPQARTDAPPATIDMRALRDDLIRWEGNKPFMYLCTAGHVTTGIGNKLSTAEAAAELPWQHRTTGAPATPGEIRAAFARVAAMTSEFRTRDPHADNPFKASHYEGASDLVLPNAVIKQLATDRLRTDFLPGLRDLFPSFDAYPRPAQRALVDMAYSLGVAGLRTKFPRLVEACRAGNFERAADESGRKNAQERRNAATHDLFMEAERLKTSIHPIAREVRP